MPRKLRIRKRMSAEGRKTAILEACKPLFAAKGFEKTTTREIAEAAGITEPILYRHFENKEALYRALETFCVGNASSIVDSLNQIPQGTRRYVMLVQAIAASLVDVLPGAERSKHMKDAEITYRLILNSLLADGSFARNNNRASVGPFISVFFDAWSAARREGDIQGAQIDEEDFWILFEMAHSPGFHNLTRKSVSGRKSKGPELARRMTILLLRATGVSESAIRKYVA